MQINPSFPLWKSARYFPFQSGNYGTDPGLYRLGTDFGNGAADHRVFQLDENWQNFRANKEDCRKEDIRKYYQQQKEKSASLQRICRFIMRQLAKDYPDIFTLREAEGIIHFQNLLTQENVRVGAADRLISPPTYLNLFDALSCQLQEDLAIWQLEDKKDWMSTIHLCAPNHWSPADKIGRTFSVVHAPVAEMEQMRIRYMPMLKSLLKGGSFVRFAWGLATDSRLNHHPEPPDTSAGASREGRGFDPEHPKLYVRVERQTLTGFQEVQAVLFSIHTYFEPVAALEVHQKLQVKKALQSMSGASLAYKGLEADYEKLMLFLS